MHKNTIESPIYIDVINKLASRLGLTDKTVQALNKHTLIAAAQQSLGHSAMLDAHADDALDVLLTTLSERDFSFTDAMSMRTLMLHAMKNNMLFNSPTTAQEQIFDSAGQEVVDAPIFIVGFLRTGTTLLHNLLAQDSEHRAVKFWQARQPMLTASYWEKCCSYTACSFVALGSRLLGPEMQYIHRVAPSEYEECIWFLEASLQSPTFFLYQDFEAYKHYLFSNENAERFDRTYQIHKKHLQLLQKHYHFKGRWILKSPFHAAMLGGLRRVYPDAPLIVTHRDPGEVLPSFCSLIRTVRRMTGGDTNSYSIGRFALEFYDVMIDQLDKVSSSSAPVVDVHYDYLTSDTAACIGELYELLNMTLSQDAEQKISQRVAKTNRSGRSKHYYAAEDFGISKQELQHRRTGFLQIPKGVGLRH